MIIRFQGGDTAAEKLKEAIEKELNALPQQGEIEIGDDRVTAEELRKAFKVEEDCCLMIDDQLPPEAFGYMMFVLSMSGFTIEDSEILEPRAMPELAVPEFLFQEEMPEDEDEWYFF